MKLFMVLFNVEALVTLQVCTGQEQLRPGQVRLCPTCSILPEPKFEPYVRRNRYCEAFRRLPNPFYGGFCLLHGVGKREATGSIREYQRDYEALRRSINNMKKEDPPKGHGDSILVTKLRK